MNISEKIYAATRRIPKGRVATYGDLAFAIGRPRAWRHVGNVLNKNRDPKTPCHRVIRSDGLAGGFGYPGGTAQKVRRLKAEQVLIRSGKVDMPRHRIASPRMLV